jgi:hypothetical protein
MPGFADSFWSSDYAAGLGVLFTKLQQGVHENRQVLTIARLRAEAEETYGQRLGDIAPAADKIAGGFSRDDGATVRKVCEHSSLSRALTACAADLLYDISAFSTKHSN